MSRLDALERAIAALQAQQNAISRAQNRRYGRNAVRGVVADQHELESRLRRGALTGAQWPTRSETPSAPAGLSAPLLARLADVTSEGVGYGAVEEEPGVAFYDLIVNHLPNGSFSQAPPDPLSDISNLNPLPGRWELVRVGNPAAITASVIGIGGDAAVEFRMNAGNVGDTLYLRRTIRIPQSNFAHTPLGVVATATSSVPTGPPYPTMVLRAQFLQEDAVTATGAESVTTLNTLGGIDTTVATYPEGGKPPEDAAYVRVQVGLERNGNVSSTVLLYVYDVRIVLGFDELLIANRSDPLGVHLVEPGQLIKDAGVVSLRQNLSGVGARLDLDTTFYAVGGVGGDVSLAAGTGGRVLVTADGGLTISALAATPATPPVDTYALYPKTDGILYGLNDAGVEVALNGGGAGITPVMFFLS